ncbi:hypothetical protein GPECTOR_11g284 [Gonium pectorale]|uniref:Uncharacterized protein n=1 Tax=Gonium pectorale TaxID=33097 RepID=A0A150GPV9_GONPE|nr:hypothetical protein GPECTOR_11g284 [Gonium pectorale]|eukprot:KXZ51845.1 hypothetical protein GPECTOR_11g284 [Gonium pectorale]
MNGKGEVPGSGSDSFVLFKKPTDSLIGPTADLAAERPSSAARICSPSGTTGGGVGGGSALSDVFSNWRKPKVRTSEVTPVEDTADEVSPLSAPGPAPASSAPSASGSPRASDGAGRSSAPSAAPAASGGDMGDGAGNKADSARATPTAGAPRTTPPDGGALAQRLLAGLLAEQHPGMVTIASFKDSESSEAGAAGGQRTSASAMAATRGSLADGGAKAGGAAGGAASSEHPVALMDEPRPTFLRRGASCSGAEPPAAFLMAAAEAAPALGHLPRGTMARRSSYAGDSSVAGLMELQPLVPPAMTPVAFRPSPSLRPTPLSPQPQAPQPLLQPSPSLRPGPPSLLLQPSPSLRPTPLNNPGASLLQSPSLLRQPPGQQKLMLPSPSLLRTPGGDSAGAGGSSASGSEQQLKLPPQQPMLLHNGCSFSRHVSTSAAVAALGTLRPIGSMPRHGALAPIATAPTPEEAAAALNRLASLQMLHRQKQEQQQQQPPPQQQQQQGGKDSALTSEKSQPFAASAEASADAKTDAEATGCEDGAAEVPPAPMTPEKSSQAVAEARSPTAAVAAAAASGADSDDEGSEADSFVGELPAPPPPPPLRQPPVATGSGSAIPGHAFRASESMQPMRRAASDEPFAAGKAPVGTSDLARSLALSDTGGAGAAAGGVAGLAPAGADPRIAHGSHAARWLESLQPPATAERRNCPEPIEPIPEPEISAGSLASSSVPDCKSSGMLVPPAPALGRVATLRAAEQSAPAPADSFKCLLQEIEP